MRTVSRIALALLALILTSVALVGTTAPANAATYFRYWMYFSAQDGTYDTYDKGVGATVPKDGSIEAFRFAASDTKNPNQPRIDLASVDFDAVCGDTAAMDGQKRVAVLIDFGVDADSKGQVIPEPEAACAQAATKATGLQVLQSVAEVRTESSSFGPLLCAIDGYPEKKCANDESDVATPADDGFLDLALNADSASDDATDATDGSDSSDASEDDDDSNNAPLYMGLGVVVVVLVAGGVYVTRRRSS
jgi:hypothetical protein